MSKSTKVPTPTTTTSTTTTPSEVTPAPMVFIDFVIKGLSFIGTLVTTEEGIRLDLSVDNPLIQKSMTITDVKTIGSILSFGAKKKMQNNFAGRNAQYLQGIEEAFEVWEQGYFTIAEKTQGELSPAKGAKKTPTAKMLVKIFSTLEGKKLANAQSVPSAILIEGFKNEEETLYNSFVKEIQEETALAREKAIADVAKLFN